MIRIKDVFAREILDSRGDPTVEVQVVLADGLTNAVASVPSGASTGSHEAVELRDGDKKRYHGKGVLKACRHINEIIAPKLKGVEVTRQQEIDKIMLELDGTPNKSKLGANAILGVSLAVARTAAKALHRPLYAYIKETYVLPGKDYRLPIPLFNIFNGGKHASTNLDFQEFMVIPVTDKPFHERLRIGSEIFHTLGRVLQAAGLDIDVGNEGGYAPEISSSVDAVEYIMQAIKQAGYKAYDEIALGMDAGASTFYLPKEQLYNFSLDNSFLDSDQLIYLYREWFEKYPFLLLEDPLAEDDWQAWVKISREFARFNLKVKNYKLAGHKFIRLKEKQLHPLIVGDDLFTTNTHRLNQGIKLGAANAVIVKLNQIGTLTETIEFANLARQHDYTLIVSHRSGETYDDFIADLSVALGSQFIKAGAPSRGERVAKYNRLLKIEQEITNN